MAPPRRYPPPNVQLVELLERSRLEGLSFEEAWQRALRPGHALVLTNTRQPPAGALLWPTDSAERLAWRSAIAEIKDSYRRAYQRRPATARERAVRTLVSVLGDGIAAGSGVGSPA